MRRAPHTPTRRTRTIALAVLLCGLGASTPIGAQTRTTVRLHLIDRADLAPDTRRELMREAVQPWLDAGVDVRWAPDDLAAGGPEDVYVTLKRAGHDSVPGNGSGLGRPLASILFVDGRPTTQITADVTVVERLAATARLDDRPWSELPGLLRERSIGRALGRAVAHEVGHYVFASAAHAASGLMRAQHPIDRLLTSSGAPFRVIPPPLRAVIGREIGSILGAP